MEFQFSPALKSFIMRFLLILMISISILILSSIVTNDWIIEKEWQGSLFAFISGEYEGQQYLYMYCAEPSCYYHRLGAGGVIYLIFSVISLILLLVWIVIAFSQLYLATQIDKCIRYFLAIGSAVSFHLGFFCWLSLTEFYYFRTTSRYPIGPTLAVICSLMYPIIGINYIKLFNDYTELPQDQANQESYKSHDFILEENPKMLSVRVEGRHVYEDSVRIEEQLS